jgi:hypothetical protein
VLAAVTPPDRAEAVVLYETEGASGRVRELEVGGVLTRLLESCHSTWVFQPERMRFRRVPLGATVGITSESEWQPYHRLDIDLSTGAFAVALNPEGTRLLRSWLHFEPCIHCQTGDETAELSLEVIGERR